MKIFASHIIFSVLILSIYSSVYLSFDFLSFPSFFPLLSFFFFLCVSCSPGFLQTHKVAENDLEYLTLLLLPLECWDYRCALSHFFSYFQCGVGLEPLSLCMQGKNSISWTVCPNPSLFIPTDKATGTNWFDPLLYRHEWPQMHTPPVVFPSSLVLSLVYFSSS